jgi:hypothetical protein
MVRILACALVAMLACSPSNEGGAVLVEVQTDFVPGREFRSVRVSVAPAFAPATEIAGEARDVTGGVAEEEAFREGFRVAELGSLSAGPYRVSAVLRDGEGEIVARRSVLVEVGTTTRGVRIVLTRSCTTITCPGAGPSELTECEGGRCVDPRCGASGRDACPVAVCVSDAACSVSASCARGACTDTGSCLAFGDSSRCGVMEYCRPETGCEPIVISMPDAGFDGGPDGGPDAGPPWDPDTDAALVMWLRFEETGATHPGTAPGDAFSATCTMLSCPTSAPGIDGQGVSFDGTDDRLGVPHAPALLTARGLTISAWVSIAAVPATAIQSIVAKPFGSSFRNSWQLALIDTDSDGEAELAFAMDDTSSEATASVEIPVGAGTFVLVTGVYDGSRLRLYVDGTTTGPGVNLASPLFDSSDVLIGADSNSGTVGDFFRGIIDDVRLYTRALSAAEVARLHEATR